ncbi:organic hydroperoxide resistance protein [Streptomyces sp. ST2-7A]|uniref:organic hydroperoxide resistance protein n=1 Tax=Streptomyces sp. ST2-7A TaxID=2907214 RepID=UPI001F339C72|nr:organic hydroperoxide resistance protein [Streptomyces sp. ST2-7A]MCE7082668.1 organic hydroperoxide resistance protein [Streptomyces sp. ST2-7A]
MSRPTPVTPLYTATATAGGGRDGRARTATGSLDLELRTPAELGGPGGGTNPEELFAAGYAACFSSALGLVARRARADVSGAEVTADVSLGKIADSEGFGLAVRLTVRIPGAAEPTARALVEAAHGVCPYSNAVGGNVVVDLRVETGGAVGA